MLISWLFQKFAWPDKFFHIINVRIEARLGVFGTIFLTAENSFPHSGTNTCIFLHAAARRGPPWLSQGGSWTWLTLDACTSNQYEYHHFKPEIIEVLWLQPVFVAMLGDSKAVPGDVGHTSLGSRHQLPRVEVDRFHRPVLRDSFGGNSGWGHNAWQNKSWCWDSKYACMHRFSEQHGEDTRLCELCVCFQSRKARLILSVCVCLWRVTQRDPPPVKKFAGRSRSDLKKILILLGVFRLKKIFGQWDHPPTPHQEICWEVQIWP